MLSPLGSSFPYVDQSHLQGHPMGGDPNNRKAVDDQHTVKGLYCSPRPDELDLSHLDNHPQSPN
jgi:hypothetical protein